MKNIFYLALILFTHSMNAQDLTQLEFELINTDVKHTIIYQIHESKDFSILKKKFNLSKKDSELLEKLIAKKNVKFSKQKDSKSHIFPFYFLTENPNELQLTLFSLTVEEKRPKEDFSRGKYHFILTSTVKMVDGKPSFKNSTLLTDSQAIQQWFLNGYKTYLENTKPVFEKYNFIPPPPPIPPYHLK